MQRAILAVFLLAAGAVAWGGEATLPETGGLTHVSTMVIPSPQNPLHGVYQIYLNEAGREVFAKQGQGGYPEGTIFIGKVYQLDHRPEGFCLPGALQAFIMMEKAPQSPESKKTGGWIFRKFDAQGKPVRIDAARDCFTCHAPHKDSDYVLSRPME